MWVSKTFVIQFSCLFHSCHCIVFMFGKWISMCTNTYRVWSQLHLSRHQTNIYNSNQVLCQHPIKPSMIRSLFLFFLFANGSILDPHIQIFSESRVKPNPVSPPLLLTMLIYTITLSLSLQSHACSNNFSSLFVSHGEDFPLLSMVYPPFILMQKHMHTFFPLIIY
jgi:hypothetical protein